MWDNKGKTYMMCVYYFLYRDIDHRFGYQGCVSVLINVEL